MDAVLKDRYRGALIGLAMGNALGFLPEKRPRAFCVDFCHKWHSGDTLPIRVRQHFTFGQVTADVQLALLTADMILANKTSNGEDFARRFLELAKDRPIVSAEPSIRWTLFQMKKGRSYQDVQSQDDTYAAVPRIVPLAMAFAGHPARLLNETIENVRTTHQNHDAVVCAAITAMATSMALTVAAGNLDPMQFITSLRAIFYDVSRQAFELLGLFQEWIEIDDDSKVIEALNGIGGREAPSDRLTPSAFAPPLFGLFCFFKHPDDFDKAIMRAVSAGGATATSGAIAGCLSGCYLGDKTISDTPIQIKDKKQTIRRDLRTVADKLLKLRTSLDGHP